MRFIIIFFILPFSAHSFNSTSFNRDSVLSRVTEYTSRLSDYCSCKGVNWESKSEDIAKLFEIKNDTNSNGDLSHHSVDLFKNEKGTQLATYLFAIYDNYQNNIAITFSKITVTNCVNQDFVRVSAQKKIEWGSSSKTIPIIIDVDISTVPYVLRSVWLQSEVNMKDCKVNKSTDDKPTIVQKPTEENKPVTSKEISNDNLSLNSIYTSMENKKYYNYYISLADERFKNGSYNKAKKYYKTALQYQSASVYAESMISMCESTQSNDYHSSNPYLSITHGFPSLLEAGKKYSATVVFSYDNLAAQEAKLEINLPDGCTATANYSEIQGSTFEINNKKIEFVWNKLPQQTPFIIKYTVHVSPTILNSIHGKYTGSFSYRENGILNSTHFDNDFYKPY